MNDTQRSKVMRAEKLVVYLGDNATELSTLANVADFKIELESKIDETNNNDTTATADTTGVTESKTAESAEMVTSSLKLAAFLQIHAQNVGDKVLKNLIDFKRSELTGKSDNDRRNAARFLAEKAAETEIAAALAALSPVAYGPDDLAAHVTNVDEYDDLIGRPNEQRSVKSAYTKAVARNIVELDDIVARLRINMAPVEFLNQTLFDAFEAAALIDDAPSHSNSNFSGSIDPNGQKKISNITYDATEELSIQNTGTTTLQLSFRSEDGIIFGEPTEIESGSILVRTFADIAPDGTEVWLQNMSADTAGSYILDLL